jgi:uncharacterized membrane protein YeiH
LNDGPSQGARGGRAQRAQASRRRRCGAGHHRVVDSPESLIPWLRVAVESAATVAFALSGLLAGARQRLDAVGLCFVTGLAAFGGGTLRDVLLDRRPFFWVEHAHWLWALLGLCVAAMIFMRRRHFAITERAMQWPDALGLGLFGASGT